VSGEAGRSLRIKSLGGEGSRPLGKNEGVKEGGTKSKGKGTRPEQSHVTKESRKELSEMKRGRKAKGGVDNRYPEKKWNLKEARAKGGTEGKQGKTISPRKVARTQEEPCNYFRSWIERRGGGIV